MPRGLRMAATAGGAIADPLFELCGRINDVVDLHRAKNEAVVQLWTQTIALLSLAAGVVTMMYRNNPAYFDPYSQRNGADGVLDDCVHPVGIDSLFGVPLGSPRGVLDSGDAQEAESRERSDMTAAVIAGTMFVVGLGALIAAFLGPRPPRADGRSSFNESLLELLPTIKEGEEQNLRLAGMTPETYAMQRFIGLIVGLIVGPVGSWLWGRGPVGTVLLIIAAVAFGWFLPMLGVRDTAKKARAELDQVIRVWIVLVAQQVSAGVDPSVAMLDAARAGKRPSWILLQRFLVSANQERRAAWEGLLDIVERYGIHTLTPVVSALGLAAERGTRISEAVLVAAKTLWDDTNSREREAASRRAEIVILPATGIALALACILVYPPFTSLTGGGGAGL